MNAGSYESADAETLAEILREAESKLGGQLQAAIAADQRAMTFSGLLVAGVAAMIGFAEDATKPSLPLMITATLLGLAAAAALWSARPTRWGLLGTNPSEWLNDLAPPVTDLHRSKAEMIGHYDGALRRNAACMRSAAWAMRISLSLTAVALIFSIGWAWTRALS